MDPSTLIFLTSGIFLGWSLGSNDAANVFGTAVASRMIRFTTAATLCAIAVVIGSVVGGAGVSDGLGELGRIDAIAGAFVVALAAAMTVFGMTKTGVPVSTTQAIVGAILGWNFFSGSATDTGALSRVIASWISGPILGAIFAFVLYKITLRVVGWAKLHLIWLDLWTRVGLILAGIFGAFSLGANNIGNVIGVFVPSSPFHDVHVGSLFTVSSVQQLCLVGGLAIAVGAFYSRPVMMTIGRGIMPVSAVAAWVVVVAHSMVLLTFSSKTLSAFSAKLGLPPIPLVPVSSSQAVVGAVIGIAMSRGVVGVRQVRWSILANIGMGWVATPVIAAIICFVLLFVVQNVFQQEVFAPATSPPPVVDVERGLTPGGASAAAAAAAAPSAPATARSR